MKNLLILGMLTVLLAEMQAYRSIASRKANPSAKKNTIENHEPFPNEMPEIEGYEHVGDLPVTIEKPPEPEPEYPGGGAGEGV